MAANLRKACLLSVAFGLVSTAALSAADRIPAPTAADWANLGKLPDWSGTWSPDETKENMETEKNPTPWNAKAAKRIEDEIVDNRNGHPHNSYTECLPEGMPSWMLIYHNAIEFLYTPNRVTMLGESEGNELRRIHTDGRKHPADPDETFFGDSIGHWEGSTLVVDTVGVMKELPISIEEAFGVPNGGDMHIVEHMHVENKDEWHDDLEITAPHAFTKTWKTNRVFYRQRAREFEIAEGVCLRGHYTTDTDKDGFPVLAPLPFTDGIPTPLKGK